MGYGTGSNCLGMEAMGIDVSLPRKNLKCKAKTSFWETQGIRDVEGGKESERKRENH